MDETNCFSKVVPEKGLAQNKSQARWGKKSKTGLMLSFLTLLERMLLKHWSYGEILNPFV